MLYSREFLNRQFYTDSSGVHLSFDDAAIDSINIEMSVPDAYRSVEAVNIYLLTAAQMKHSRWQVRTPIMLKIAVPFNEDGGVDAPCARTKPLAMSPVHEAGITHDSMRPIMQFTPLPADTDYICRTVVTLSSVELCDRDKLDVTTLKRHQVQVDEDGVVSTPTVVYNRSTGAFDVFRPMITVRPGSGAIHLYGL